MDGVETWARGERAGGTRNPPGNPSGSPARDFVTNRPTIYVRIPHGTSRRNKIPVRERKSTPGERKTDPESGDADVRRETADV